MKKYLKLNPLQYSNLKPPPSTHTHCIKTIVFLLTETAAPDKKPLD